MRHAPYISIVNAKLKTQLSSFLPHKFSHFRELSRSQRHISITYCNAIIYTNQPSTHDVGGMFCTSNIFIYLHIHTPIYSHIFTLIIYIYNTFIFEYIHIHTNARNAGVQSPSQNQQRPQRGRPLPLAIYGEGGGRQAGGEVRGQAVRSKTRF